MNMDNECVRKDSTACSSSSVAGGDAEKKRSDALSLLSSFGKDSTVSASGSLKKGVKMEIISPPSNALEQELKELDAILLSAGCLAKEGGEEQVNNVEGSNAMSECSGGDESPATGSGYDSDSPASVAFDSSTMKRLKVKVAKNVEIPDDFEALNTTASSDQIKPQSPEEGKESKAPASISILFAKGKGRQPSTSCRKRPQRKSPSSSCGKVSPSSDQEYVSVDESIVEENNPASRRASTLFHLKSENVSVPEGLEGLPSYLSQINFSPRVPNPEVAASLRDRRDSNSSCSNHSGVINVDSKGEICVTSGDILCRAVEKADFMNRKINSEFGRVSSGQSWKMSWIELRNEYIIIYKEDKHGRPGGSKQLVKRTANSSKGLAGLITLLAKSSSNPSPSATFKTNSSHQSKAPLENIKGDSVTAYMPYSKRPIGYVIHLGGCVVEPAYNTTGRKYTLRILTSRNFEIVFGCTSLDMMADWIDAISKRIEEIGECKENIVQDSEEFYFNSKHVNRLIRKHRVGGKDKERVEDLPFFGMSLISYCQRTGKSFPDFIRNSFKTIESKAIDNEGLYRICGNSHVLQILKDKLNVDENANFQSQSVYDNDINVLCGLVKMFFRELKEPLLMFSCYNDFVAAADIKDEIERLETIKNIITDQLVMPHRDLLFILLKHLKRIHSHSKLNKMPASNLALLFGPSILRPESDDVTYFVHIAKISTVVTLMILNVDTIFGSTKGGFPISCIDDGKEPETSSDEIDDHNHENDAMNVNTDVQEGIA